MGARRSDAKGARPSGWAELRGFPRIVWRFPLKSKSEHEFTGGLRVRRRVTASPGLGRLPNRAFGKTTLFLPFARAAVIGKHSRDSIPFGKRNNKSAQRLRVQWCGEAILI
jgi:hypothetical protein